MTFVKWSKPSNNCKPTYNYFSLNAEERRTYNIQSFMLFCMLILCPLFIFVIISLHSGLYLQAFVTVIVMIACLYNIYIITMTDPFPLHITSRE